MVMITGWQKAWVAGLIALLAGLLPMPTTAQPIDAAQACHATAAADETYAALRHAPERWICSSSRYDFGPERQFMRFRLSPNEATARSFVTQASPFELITIWVVDQAGGVKSARFGRANVHHLTNGPLMAATLPLSNSAPRMVVVRIDKPWNKNIISQARLDSDPRGSGWPIREVVVMAIISGLLIVPLVLNFGLYAVLRLPYALWHVVMVSGMLVQNLLLTGFIHIFIELNSDAEAAISMLCLGVILSSALLFMGSFIEQDCQSPWMRRLLRHSAPALILGFLIATLPFDAMRPYGMIIIAGLLGINFSLLFAAMGDAWRRKSRAVYFLIAGWTPALAVGLYRIACYLLPNAKPTDEPALVQFTLAIEVIASTLGIVFRFVELRREAENASLRALTLETAANHDPLTGLMNRHLIEERFATLYAEGFRTMAVIDLDHFKAVNDSHGHAVGDAVLRAVGLALTDDPQARAFRMGGEEFLLLIRGTNAAERAERARRAITTRIAATVPGLDRLVTASMGVVAQDLSPPQSEDFSTLYARCDELLYKAKRAGRNRNVCERAKGFDTDHGNAELPAHPPLRA